MEHIFPAHFLGSYFRTTDAAEQTTMGKLILFHDYGFFVFATLVGS
ncbi:MAG: hypothetical protein [Bacteriophage sp.]|jgi:hypothetical protein|nr:MAG: hypothetical protein [Bacteriophage sp.]DAQ48663.1 MAG TPA: hypothetical protein [Caudoviricetes sp.]